MRLQGGHRLRIYQRTTVYLILAACLSLSGCCNSRINYQNLSPKPKGSVRVVTYNLNYDRSGRDHRDPMRSIHAMEVIHADILLLQETTLKWEKLILKSFARYYKYHQFYERADGGGMAILSRYHIKSLHLIKPPIGWHTALLADVLSPIGDLQILNVHLTPPLNKDKSIGFLGIELFRAPGIRNKEMQFLYKKLAPNKKTIIAGDFNENYPGRAIKFLHKKDFYDTLWVNNNYSDTWCWRCFIFVLSNKFDHQFIQPNLTPLQIQVLHEGSSDHYPVIVDYS